MLEVDPEILVQIVKEHAKEDIPDDVEVKTVSYDPAHTTYEIHGYWVKVPRSEPKNPAWTTLHREHFALEKMYRMNRSTVDFALHVPITTPLHIGSAGEKFAWPFLVVKALSGKSLASFMQGDADLGSNEAQQYGEIAGKYLARIHAIQVKGAGLINPGLTGVHPGPWQKYFQLVAEAEWKQLKLSNVVDAHLLERLAALTEKKKGLLIGEIVALAHNDYNFANILVDPEKLKIIGVLNFYQAGAASAMADISAFYIHCHNEVLWNAFAKGYEAVRSMPGGGMEKLSYYAFHFGMNAAAFFHARGHEANKGYYLRRALESAARLDDSFNAEASKYSSFRRVQYRAGT